MDIKEALLAEHSKAQTQKIIDYVGDDKTKLKELFNCFIGDNYRLSQRASWPISYIAENHPVLFLPYLKRMIKNLHKPDIHDAVKRNTVRVFEVIAVPERLQGEIYDLCYNFIFSLKEPIAVRCFSIGVISNIADSNPALKEELDIAFEVLKEESSAGIQSRLKRYYRKKK
jgi:hypothetical protein